jgi:hypothetical protein
MAFADDIAARFAKGSKTPPPAPAADDDAPKAADSDGSKGRMLAAALKKGDGEAIEAAVRAICDDDGDY